MIAALKESGLPFSLQTLFGTKAGKEALAEFLVNSGIYTAKWYTNTGQLEEDQ